MLLIYPVGPSPKVHKGEHSVIWGGGKNPPDTGALVVFDMSNGLFLALCELELPKPIPSCRAASISEETVDAEFFLQNENPIHKNSSRPHG